LPAGELSAGLGTSTSIIRQMTPQIGKGYGGREGGARIRP